MKSAQSNIVKLPKSHLYTKKVHLKKSPFANLFKSKQTGVYFLRAKILGKQVKVSLKVKNYAVAQVLVRERHAELTADIERERAKHPGGSTFGVFEKEWIRRSEASPDYRPRTKIYHQQCVDILYRTWPELETLEVATIKLADCIEWAAKLRARYSAPRYNGAVDTARAVFDIAIERGAILKNPTRGATKATGLKKARVTPKRLELPTTAQFQELLAKLDSTPRFQRAARAVRFLAYGGPRISSAGEVMVSDVDWARNEIILRKTKNGKICRVPMIPEMQDICRILVTEYPGKGPLLPIKNPRHALKKACEAIGIHPLTNHDLRHLFITRCIESGVDVKTVAEWVGHQDGGALILKTYAHLRNEHSQKMAAKVRFG